VRSELSANARRGAGWALVAGLSVAALTAVVALLVGSFDDTEVRVILTSIGFAVASSIAASGTAQLARSSPWLRRLGAATAALSGVAFALLLAGLWTDDWGTEGIWRAFGCSGLIAVAGSHACVVVGARRPTDGEGIRMLVSASIVLATLDTVGALIPLSGLADDVDEGAAKLFAASLVLLLLTTLLPPILRRLERTPRHASAPGRAREDALILLASEVETIADRIDELSRDGALRLPEVRRETQRMRELARSFQR
jgi:hypothetical protein